MKITPMGDRIVIKVDSGETQTSSGILIPETASKARPKSGKVVFIGKGATTKSGKRIPPQVKEGDQVFFTEWAGTEIEIEGEKHLIMKEEEILAVK